jgi:hypothetical protein
MRNLPWASVLVLSCLRVQSSSLLAQAPAGIAASALPAAVVDAIPVTLDAAAKQKLTDTGSTSSFFHDQPMVDLCPNAAAAADILRAMNGAHPNIGVQTLVVAAMPGHLVSRPDRDLVLYNLLHQFRTMEGIQYYSATHGMMRVLFTASYRVKGPGDLAMLADPHYPSIEPSHEIHLLQDDTTFGKNLYTATFKGLEKGAVEFAMSNVEKVKYGILTVLGPDAMKLTLVIQPSADGRFLYFYGNVGLQAAKLPGLETTVRTSFYNRIIAYYNWFAKQAAKG